MSSALTSLGYNCFRRDKLEGENRERGKDEILKINKVCVSKAASLRSDSFHLAALFYFPLCLFLFIFLLTLKFGLFGETLKGLVGAA